MLNQTHEILVIDDDQDLNARLCQVLTKAGYHTASAKSAEDGLSWLHHSSPGLILLDINMPGMGGLGFLKKIQADPRGSTIPIVVLTARSAMESFFDGMPVGGFLAKPCNPDDLLKQVERLLPLAPEPPSANDPREAATGRETGVILLGEDDPRIARELQRRFAAAGYLTLPAVTLTDMYDATERTPPDAIIMHSGLHSLSDTQVVPMLRGFRSAPQRPVLTYYVPRHNTHETSCGFDFTPGLQAFLELPNAMTILQAIDSVLTSREKAA